MKQTKLQFSNESIERHHPFIDVEIIHSIDTRENFIIRCEDKEELERIKEILSIKSKKISAQKFIQWLSLLTHRK